MTKADLATYQNTLLSLRNRLLGHVSHLADEQANGAGRPSADPADQGSDTYDQEFALNLIQNQEQVLEEIGDALERLRRGTFGRCEECAGPVPKSRLQALPYARHCVPCARKHQQRP
jgi:RNA polymerase-binding protein DksA